MTPGRPAFRLVLVQVDRNIEMVDQDKGDSRPNGLPESLKLAYSFYGIDDCKLLVGIREMMIPKANKGNIHETIDRRL